MLRGQQDALGDFLAGLRNLVDAAGERLDVLRLQGGEEAGAERLVDLRRDGFVLATGRGKFVERNIGAEVLQELPESANALASLLGTGFKQIEEPVFFSQQFL